MRWLESFTMPFRIASCVIAAMLLVPGTVRAADTADPAVVPATVDPLPAGWKAGQFDSGNIKTGKNSDLNAHFELHSNPKSSLGNFPDWAKRAKDQEAEDSPITNRNESDLKPTKAGDIDALEYEITGELFGQPMHYRVFLAQVRGVYCKMLCWTDAKNWNAAEPKFAQLIANLK